MLRTLAPFALLALLAPCGQAPPSETPRDDEGADSSPGPADPGDDQAEGEHPDRPLPGPVLPNLAGGVRLRARADVAVEAARMVADWFAAALMPEMGSSAL